VLKARKQEELEAQAQQAGRYNQQGGRRM
jgi:hypothetical protein